MIKLILVEDDPFLLSILTKKLEINGFAVDTAVDGEEALKKIKDNGFDLILLDVILPKIDGFKILEELRGDEQTKKIPVIVLSNLYDKNNIDKAISLGAKEYIVKAYHTPEEIISKIKTFLNKGNLLINN